LVLPATSPLGLRLFGMRYVAFEVRPPPPPDWRASAHFFLEISRLRFVTKLRRHSPNFQPAVVIVIQPLHPTGAWLLRRDLHPLVGLFIASDALVGRVPLDFNGDAWPSAAQCSDVLPCLKGVLLAGTRFVLCHPPDGCLRI